MAWRHLLLAAVATSGCADGGVAGPFPLDVAVAPANGELGPDASVAAADAASVSDAGEDTGTADAQVELFDLGQNDLTDALNAGEADGGAGPSDGEAGLEAAVQASDIIPVWDAIPSDLEPPDTAAADGMVDMAALSDEVADGNFPDTPLGDGADVTGAGVPDDTDSGSAMLDTVPWDCKATPAPDVLQTDCGLFEQKGHCFKITEPCASDDDCPSKNCLQGHCATYPAWPSTCGCVTDSDCSKPFLVCITNTAWCGKCLAATPFCTATCDCPANFVCGSDKICHPLCCQLNQG